MDEMVARCRSCGFEQKAAFDRCEVCGDAPGWWCRACHDWRAARACPACGGHLEVPPEIKLGSFPPGTRVPVRFAVRNPGRKPLDFSVYPGDLALNLPTNRRTVRAGDTVEIAGTLVLGRLPPGRRTYKVRIEAPIPAETDLVVEVVPAVRRLEFSTPEVEFRKATPGKILRRAVTIKNTGNVPLSAAVSGSEPWLTALPAALDLAPGGTATVKVAAQTRKSDHGVRVGRLRVEGEGGPWEAAVRLFLPEPQLRADPVNFGTVRPARPAYQTLALRNVGKVRVACVLAADQP